jgi:hypothetical protein
MAARRRCRVGYLFWAQRVVNGQVFGVDRNSPLFWALHDQPAGTVVALDDVDYVRLEGEPE